MLSAGWGFPGHLSCPWWEPARSPPTEAAGVTLREPVTTGRARAACRSPHNCPVRTGCSRSPQTGAPPGNASGPHHPHPSFHRGTSSLTELMQVQSEKYRDHLPSTPFTFHAPVLRLFKEVSYPVCVTFLFTNISTHHTHTSFALSQIQIISNNNLDPEQRSI